VNIPGKYLSALLAVVLLSISANRYDAAFAQTVQPEAAQLLALANQARAEAGAGPLKWDESLAIAAREHSLRMAAEGPLSHRYPGELALSERAGKTGAHFSVIEENIALGPTPAEIHEEWMHSEGHRTNLLNPEVDRVGIAVVASRGLLYATADYSRGVQSLSQREVEARVAAFIQPRGLMILRDSQAARDACAMESGIPASAGDSRPRFIMRWQDSDLSKLPEGLTQRIETGLYHKAAVGSCGATSVAGSFTAYRVAVILY
jgi:hypothetical protein